MKELWIKPPDGKEFIYAIVHRKTQKAYIGRTSNSIEVRLSAHLNALRGQRHHIEDMQEDFNKYGEDYDFFILDVVDAKRICPNKIERYYMNKYESDIRGKGYNYKDKSFLKNNEISSKPVMTNRSYEKFERLLKDNNTTAYRVSKDTGISTATLTSWKKGIYKPKLDKMAVLADYFNVPLGYFLND